MVDALGFQAPVVDTALQPGMFQELLEGFDPGHTQLLKFVAMLPGGILGRYFRHELAVTPHTWLLSARPQVPNLAAFAVLLVSDTLCAALMRSSHRLRAT